MKNKEFWKGAVAGALVVTCIGTGVFAGTGLAAKGTALGDRKCTSKLAYLESTDTIWEIRMKKSFRKGFMQVFSMGWMILIPDIIQQRNTILRILPMREAMWGSAFLWRRTKKAE
mgnify:CR=1 FL=1